MTGAELRQLRQSAGLTQRALGAALDVPVNTIALWERGARSIRHGQVLRLAIERVAAREDEPTKL